MGILNHIQARTKSKPTFVLPLDALMNQWQDNTRKQHESKRRKLTPDHPP